MSLRQAAQATLSTYRIVCDKGIGTNQLQDDMAQLRAALDAPDLADELATALRHFSHGGPVVMSNGLQAQITKALARYDNLRNGGQK